MIRCVLLACVMLGVMFGIDSSQEIIAEIEKLDDALRKSDNLWLKQYSSLENYNNTNKEIEVLQAQLTKDLSSEDQRSLKHRLEILQHQQELLKDYAKNPYGQLLEIKNIGEIPSITNPFLILTGYSFIKHLNEQKNMVLSNQESLESLVDQIQQKYYLLSTLAETDKSVQIVNEIFHAQMMLEELEGAQKILETSLDIYSKEIDAAILKVRNQIVDQILKAVYVGVALLITILLAFLLKFTLRKYIIDTNRIYTANKAINFLNIITIILILLFSYLENVSYLVAVVGFASAGLAIAMKDLFMSVLGWFVIVLGGSVHVGDRVRACKDGMIYVGDVLDISMLRITLFEDVTLTSYMENRRAGRIIFIPNNFIFTTMFANYTHAGFKTVWDGIDFSITFDSNYKKALKISTEIGKKYAKNYTEMVKKQVYRLRDRYSLRNPNLEVRTYCMIESNGFRISLWYQTNAYATLTLRSTISGEIIERMLEEDDIFLTYPTTKVVPTGGDGRGNKPFKDPNEQPHRPRGGSEVPVDEKEEIGILGGSVKGKDEL